MISFFAKIFSGITTAIVSVAVSLGLISAPVQPPAAVIAEPAPIVQEQSLDTQLNLSANSQISNIPQKNAQQKNFEIVKPIPQQKAYSPAPNSPSQVQIPTPISLPPPPTTIYVPTHIPTPTQTPLPASATIPPPIVIKPEILRFELSKNIAKIGDELTLTWEAKNAITCAISETDNISIPFVGRLPSGSLTIKLSETVNLKIPTFKYYAICADKDWNTTIKKSTVTVLGSIEIKNANVCKTDLQTDYMLYDLLQNGNIDGRISMRIYLAGVSEQPAGNPELIVRTSDSSQDKTFKEGANSSCGYTYGEYNFYTTNAGVFPITFSVPLLNLSKTMTLNIKLPEKPTIGSTGITVSTPEKETDFPISEIDSISTTSNIKYWFQASKPNYQYSVSAWCSDNDTALTKIDMVSRLEKDGLYYYRGYFVRGGQFSGTTTCKFVNSADSSMTIFSESDQITFDVK
ncbi:MAG TPA: hypothetical protein ACFYEK_12805 [Candidatus Wunengus sp. YC60]|uniref:hypothetical protein n=1 Tax=Candidatus Wunengus sp. YC60 TaxID=3367697 RepID=UPI004025A934